MKKKKISEDIYAGYRVKSNKKIKHKEKSSKLIKFLVIALTLGILYFTSSLIINYSDVLNVNIFSAETKLLENSYYYGVYTKMGSSKEDILKECTTISAKGGAGYLWQYEDYYYAIANIYPEKALAESVAEKNSDNGLPYSVLEIIVPPLSISSSLPTKEKELIDDNINFFMNTYDYLYELSLSHDSKELTFYDCTTSLKNFQTENENSINSLIDGEVTTSSVKLAYMKIYITNAIGKISLLESSSTPNTFSSMIKYEMVSLISTLNNLIKEIKM